MDDSLTERDDSLISAPVNSVNVEVPVCNIDLSKENYGINENHILDATAYACSLKSANAPQDEQRASEVYLNQLKRQVDENEYGFTFGFKKLRNSTYETQRSINQVSKFLNLDENAPTLDLDDNSLSVRQLLLLIIQNMNRKFEGMDRKFEQKFAGFKSKFEGLERKLDRYDLFLTSLRNTARNTLLGPGSDDPDSGNTYRPVCNDEAHFPGVGNDLEPILSLRQIESMNTLTLDSYLQFYDLGTSHRSSKKKVLKIAMCLGINVTWHTVFGDDLESYSSYPGFLA